MLISGEAVVLARDLLVDEAVLRKVEDVAELHPQLGILLPAKCRGVPKSHQSQASAGGNRTKTTKSKSGRHNSRKCN